jgi:putative hydrolase of the HAD superfamily
MVKSIVFDFFGVICNEVADKWYQKNTTKEIRIKLRNTINKTADLGKISLAELFDVLGRETGLDPQQVKSDWIDKAVIDYGLLSYVKGLRNNYQTALLSNAPQGLVPEITKDINLSDYFDQVIISSNMGMIKPDPDIFTKTLELLHSKPGQCLFIDDRQINLDTAATLGINTHQYLNLAPLKEFIEDPDLSIVNND